MKICIIAPVVIPILGNDQKYGGIETVIHIASEELIKRGHDVYLFASGDSKTFAKLVATIPKALGQGGVTVEKEREANKRAYEMAIGERPDVIWDHTMAIHAHKIEKSRSKFIFEINIELLKGSLIDTGNIPVIHTLHGPAKDHVPQLIKSLSDSGHYFVTISKDQARRFLPYFNIRQHLGTVYNAIDLEEYKPDYKQKKNYFLWAGRYCMEKGPHIAIEVAHKLNTPIKLIGKVKEKHEKAYFEKFVKPILGAHDSVLGMVTNAEKAKLLKNAKAVMMTNLWAEPSGLVAAESMASGTPVIGPTLGSLTELIDQAGILVDVDDLKLSEYDTSVTTSQKKYIDRIVKEIPSIEKIPMTLPRKRAEFLFSPKHNADGYEEAFYKAIYLKRIRD